MIVVWIFAIFFSIINTVINFLPCGDGLVCADPMLPLPVAVTQALFEVGRLMYWFFGLAGDNIRIALLQSLSLQVGAAGFLFIWYALRNFRAPIIQRFTHPNKQ